MMVEEYVSKIAQRIRKRRMELGLSIRETARLTDTSPSTIQKIESNEMVPSIAVLMVDLNISTGPWRPGEGP